MTIYLATDHAGFELKNIIKQFLQNEGVHTVVDCGAHTFDPEDDYPDFIAEAAMKVSASPGDSKAVIFGGSGQGEAMLANRFPNVRATVYYQHALEIIELSRTHNDANVLAIGARFVDSNQAIEALELWLQTPASQDDKYTRRVKKAERMTARK